MKYSVGCWWYSIQTFVPSPWRDRYYPFSKLQQRIIHRTLDSNNWVNIIIVSFIYYWEWWNTEKCNNYCFSIFTSGFLSWLSILCNSSNTPVEFIQVAIRIAYVDVFTRDVEEELAKDYTWRKDIKLFLIETIRNIGTYIASSYFRLKKYPSNHILDSSSLRF